MGKTPVDDCSMIAVAHRQQAMLAALGMQDSQQIQVLQTLLTYLCIIACSSKLSIQEESIEEGLANLQRATNKLKAESDPANLPQPVQFCAPNPETEQQVEPVD